MSMPFYDEEFTFTQPDGTRIRVRGTGDQDDAVFETMGGYTITQDASTRYFHYAKLNDANTDLVPLQARVRLDARPAGLDRNIRVSGSARRAKPVEDLPPMAWQMRQAARRAALGGATVETAARPITGSYVGLCLPIQFPDVPGTIPESELDDFCNRRGYTGCGNNGSVCDYFHAVSDGKLHYTNVVAPYYTTKHGRDYYTDPSQPHRRRARELIKEALTHLVDSGFDSSALTTDNEHRVYAVNVLYAGTRVNNWSEGLWPHSSDLGRPFQLGPGRFAFDYQITDLTEELSLGTFCHENGHMLCEFPDLYDKTKNASGHKSYGIGRYCLMSSGGKPPHHKTPLQVGAYLKIKAGWTSTLYDLNEMKPGATISLRAGRNEFAILRRNPTEYFIIENRQPAGQDACLPAAGLAVWHVDEAVEGNNQEEMTAAQHFECSLVQADGKHHLENRKNQGDGGDLYHAGVHNELSDATQPSSKWWDGSSSGLHIRDISQAGGTMTFSIGPAPAFEKRGGWLGWLLGRGARQAVAGT